MWSRCVMSQVKHNSYFIMGMVVGLWVSLSVIPLDDDVEACVSPLLGDQKDLDDFEPHREERPLGSGGQSAGRSVQRPRYYTTELGMRGSVLTGVLSSEDRLHDQVAAINKTASKLQPALKFFITASAVSAPPGLANVVGFTDTREMLKPFHALKYLADNYLEEYDFFFLVTDSGYINARRLTELAGGLSVSRDLYMGIPEGESQYCSLESGILMSNSVLRAIHAELDWCVRNSYSPRHHENIGRCVLHAAHVPCSSTAQAQEYSSITLKGDTLQSPLDAIVASPAPAPMIFKLHALGARERLNRGRIVSRKIRTAMRKTALRHPPNYRNATWPAGLRNDPGLAPPKPDSRFDHLRWTAFDTERTYMPDERFVVKNTSQSEMTAFNIIWKEIEAWCLKSWSEMPSLVEGARIWEPATALRYRLVVKVGNTLRLIEAVKALTSARLAPVPYVTESARISMVVMGDVEEIVGFLGRVSVLCGSPQPDCNIYLYVALDSDARESEVQKSGQLLPLKVVVLEAADTRSVVDKLLPDLPKEYPILVVPPTIEFDRDFLNRVRMNTIRGEQWYLPVPFSRFAQTKLETGSKPPHSGRFEVQSTEIFSFYKDDYINSKKYSSQTVPELLAGSGLRCIRAPEPGAALAPPSMPCGGILTPECRAELVAIGLEGLPLGTRSSLAKLLLETQDETQ